MDNSKPTTLNKQAYFGQARCNVCNGLTMHEFEFFKGFYMKRCLCHSAAYKLPVCMEIVKEKQ